MLLCFFFMLFAEELLGEVVGIQSIRYVKCYLHILSFFPLALMCVCYFFGSKQTEKSPSLFFVSDVRMGSSKISPPALLSASLLYFTTQQHSPGSSGLVFVTGHLCQGAVQSHWWPLGAKKSKWQNGNGDRGCANIHFLLNSIMYIT